MRQVDLYANNSVNGPIGSALVRAYQSSHGFMGRSGAMVVRSAYLRIERGETTLEMEVGRMKGLSLY